MSRLALVAAAASVAILGAAGRGYAAPVDETALRHGVGVETANDDPDVAYARFGEAETVPYGGWLG